jgi:hypothetical protein
MERIKKTNNEENIREETLGWGKLSNS